MMVAMKFGQFLADRSARRRCSDRKWSLRFFSLTDCFTCRLLLPEEEEGVYVSSSSEGNFGRVKWVANILKLSLLEA